MDREKNDLDNAKNGEVDKIIEALNIIRPYLINDGGNVEFVDYTNNIVYIRVLGTCASCTSLYITLSDIVCSALREVVPSIVDVKVVE